MAFPTVPQLALRSLQVNELHLDGLILDGLVPPETTETWDLSRRTALVDQVGRQSMDERSLQQYRTLLGVKDAAWQKDVPGGDLRRFFAALLGIPALRDRMPKIVQELSEGDTRTLAATVKDWNAAVAQLGQGGNNQPALPLVMLIAASENNARPELSMETVNEDDRGAHLLSLMAPSCFVSAVGSFINGGVASERCAEPTPE